MTKEQQSKNLLELTHSNFFALRTPLLAIEELTAWSEALTASRACESGSDPKQIEKAWMEDVQVLRSRLRTIIDRPEILHALYVATPSLQAGIEHWKRDPDSKKGLQAERALVRYFARMAARATPFGLFSGCSIGRVDEQGATALILKPQALYRLCCRLDFDYLFALTSALQRDPALEMELRYWPNSSLHRIADAWHYTESRLAGTRRSHHLVKIESDPYLEAVLERAQTGATVLELVAAVFGAQGEADPSQEEAKEYVLGLIRENELLISNLSPILTGTPPLDDVIQQLESLPSGGTTASALRGIREQIKSIEQTGLNCVPSDYQAITAEIEKLPAKVDLAKLYQVDMIKPVEEAAINKAVIAELIKGVDLLCRLGQTAEPEELKSFRDAFFARYEQALVPLIEALDDEAGVGFGSAAGRADPSPLLKGLVLNRAGGEAPGRGKQLESHAMLLRQVFACAQAGKDELELDISTLRRDETSTQRLADSFCVMGTLVAASSAALQAGDFQFYLHGGVGPSGARLLGRFCHEDPEIEMGVRNHIHQEEAHDPEAVYAEVVYLPEGRIGNVLCRPVLRDYEIPYLGRSGAKPDRQLPVNDLLVGIEADNIVLYSRRLERRVIPRVTNAHGFMNPQLSSIYRFLCYMQHQHGSSVPGFSWGPLEALDYLPRIRAGRLVLSPARWKFSEKEVEAIGKEERSLRFLAVQDLRRRRNLPRWVVLQEGDNSLPVDLENVLSVDAFVHVLKRGAQATLVELYPAPHQLCVSGPEGHFYHEMHVPFVRKLRKHESDDASPRREKKSTAALTRASVSRETRTLPPGSEWLYVKLYGGGGALDEILTTSIPALARTAVSSGFAARWFFVRYSDPHDHLRIRFNGVPARISQELLPQVFATVNPLLASGKLWKIDFDTYEREVERYGGVEGVLAAEDIFFADSEAVLDILGELAGDEGLDIRWRIGLMGIDQLLTDYDFDDQTKRATIERWRDTFQREFKIDAPGKKQLSDKFRAERRKLESLFDESSELSRERQFAKQALARRSVRVREALRKLRALAANGKLETDILDLAASFSHMHINRLMRSSQRAHELVLYDFLFQIYDGRIARNSGRS
ncbi:MAG: lantibiotic dehydratase [Candidatus Sulfotelmatobacter sp.]